ncbi:MAG: MiaB/RimO family radical SAM methylthiotransferase [Candidatus Hatepunaea meridiana]|nr:MiaB/RimO family radical SAM methylthiotransferase [Candidatus Hatepunaea meridiana]
MQAYFTTHGCKLNQAETVQIRNILKAQGIISDVCQNVNSSELIFVNTCAVTVKAAAKSRHSLSRLARENPDAIIIAAGCLAQMDPDALKAINGIDYILGTDARFITDWWIGKPIEPVVALNRYTSRIKPSADADYPGRSRPFIKIQDGCTQNCTYCVIPRLRGRMRSVQRKDILTATARVIEAGAYEIVLTGVRIGSWGTDIDDVDGLTGLVNDLASLPGSFRIRLGSIEPWELNEDLVKLVSSNNKVCSHLHIPFQHTSDRVLDRMGRPPIGDVIEMLTFTRQLHPEMALGVDLIAGFPGETEEDINYLVHKLENMPVTYIHAFGFSPRSRTLAASMPDQIPPHIIKRRVTRLIEIGERKRRDFYSENIGRTLIVIPDRPVKGSELTQVISDNYLRVMMRTDEIKTGRPVKVKLKRDYLTRCKGAVLDSNSLNEVVNHGGLTAG